MTSYIIIAHAKLFSITRVVEAASKAEAAKQINQEGIRVIWIEEVTETE